MMLQRLKFLLNVTARHNKKSVNDADSFVANKLLKPGVARIKYQKRIAKAKEEYTVGNHVLVQNPRSKAPAIDQITATKTQNVVSKVSTLTPPKAIVTDPIINTRGIRKDLLRVEAIPQKHRFLLKH
jgi:hypothetical protein